LEIAKKFLDEGQPQLALERLKKILYSGKFTEEWQIHELIGVCFQDLANAEGVVQASLSAAQTDTILRNQQRHFSNYLFALHYLNPHFLDSSSARFYETLLIHYDKEKFFVSAWSLSNREDNFTKKVRNSVDKFFSFDEINFYKIAEKIYFENADVVFDLGGHSDGGETLQILSYKPAKIQISGIGYFDTTGTDFIDYFLSDEFLIKNCKKDFTEQIFLVENALEFLPSEKIIQAENSLKKIGHENFIFGCLNNFMKITDEYLQCVKKILELVPNSKIIFRDTTPIKSRKKSLEEKILSAGIKNFEVRVGEDNFFRDYEEIDLILDTFPYNGGFMTALAIYFEVPVLNLIGDKNYSRMGADILKNFGLEEWIASDEENFITKAVDFAKNPAQKIFSPRSIKNNFADDFYKKILDIMQKK